MVHLVDMSSLVTSPAEPRQLATGIIGIAGVLTILFVVITVKLILLAGFLLCVGCPENSPSASLRKWKKHGYYYHFHHYKIFNFDYMSEYYNGETLVIIHGYPTAGYDFHLMIPLLEKRFSRIIVPDLLGYGFSDKPRNHKYSVIEYADQIQDMIHTLGLHSVHILAHDVGTAVAQELLARTRYYKGITKLHHTKIETVCLMNTGGIFPELLMPIFLQRLLRIPVLKRVFGELNNYISFSSGIKEVSGEHTKPSKRVLRDLYYLMTLKNGHRIADKLQRFIDEFFTYRRRWQHALRKTKVPIGFIYGNADPVNPKRLPKVFKSAFPKSEVYIIDDIGHFLMLEAPIETSYRYLDFIDNQFYSQTSLKGYSPYYQSGDGLWKKSSHAPGTDESVEHYLMEMNSNHIDYYAQWNSDGSGHSTNRTNKNFVFSPTMTNTFQQK